MLIGGAEERASDLRSEILQEVARCGGRHGHVVLVTAASRVPESYAATYQAAFERCGLTNVAWVDLPTRAEAFDPQRVRALRGAAVVFFSGGDQSRLTEKLQGTPFLKAVRRLYAAGCTIAGTSAGAAAMARTMLAGGASHTLEATDAVRLSRGFGFLSHVVVDTHFSQRGRLGRLLGAVARKANHVGIGIDENTAIVVDGYGHCRVIGSGSVTCVVRSEGGASRRAERRALHLVAKQELRVDVLRAGARFSLAAVLREQAGEQRAA